MTRKHCYITTRPDAGGLRQARLLQKCSPSLYSGTVRILLALSSGFA
uniref:Uncharacterized protein n=1 Tax=Xanthomonas phage MK21 TaxID=3148942 RepID=A0AAU7J838_9CAUD